MRISRTACVLLALSAAFASTGASAASPAESGAPVTLLHLSVVGTVHDTPDLLVAVLDATASSADPAAAQRQLDNTMKAAADLARAGKGVAWQVTGYAVDQTPPATGTGRTLWSAHQSLSLQAGDAEALLALVGQLQKGGLAVQSLQWELSPARRLEAEQRASTEALTLLRDRAAAAASALGLRVDSIRSVTLGETDRPRPMPLMRMMAAAPPQATRSEADISQSADAEIALKP